MKGMTTCKVCGRDFPLIIEDHYIAEDPQKIGALANLINTDRALEFDAFDCPHCGCQNVMQNRKSIYIYESNIEEIEHDGCQGCKYVDQIEMENPCKQCKHCYTDKYEKGDNE